MRHRSIWVADLEFYIRTDVCEGLHREVVGPGCREMVAPMLLEHWNTTTGFIDPDSFQVGIVRLARDRKN
jgi:hypothetical protein